MAAPGKTTELSNGPNEVIRALVSSIAGEPLPQEGTPSPELMKKLANKLSELVGEEAAQSFIQGHNERGAIVNEEGLPIIDITEPTAGSRKNPANVLASDPDGPKPLASLSPAERSRRRLEQNRILDILEEEERLFLVKAREQDEAEREASLRQRSVTAKKEMARMKAAGEIQKKMGKALLRGLGSGGKANESASSFPVQNQTLDSSPNEKRKVSFADTHVGNKLAHSPDLHSNTLSENQWGDVSLAKLQAKNRPAMIKKAEGLMKMDVVERTPGRPALTVDNDKDSDDESVTHEISVTADLDDEDGSQASEPPSSSDEESDSDNSDAEPILEAEEFSLDTAQHYREIASAYYDKRESIVQATRTAFHSHSHEPNEETDDVENTSHRSKPPISPFKADRPDPSNSSSQSLDTILPVSQTQTMQNAIRIGKLDDDNKLVGDATDSESEEATLEKLSELLKQGHVYNAGPSPSTVHIKPMPPAKEALDLRHQSNSAAPRAGSAVLDSVMERHSIIGARSTPEPAPHFRSTSRNATAAERPLFSADGQMIVDSPSFRPLSRRPERPPVVVSSVVREATTGSQPSEAATAASANIQPRKVSRFMQNRS